MKWKFWKKLPVRVERTKSRKGFKFRQRRKERVETDEISIVNKILILFPAGFAGVMFLFSYITRSENFGLISGMVFGGIAVMFAIWAWKNRYKAIEGEDGWKGFAERKLLRSPDVVAQEQERKEPKGNRGQKAITAEAESIKSSRREKRKWRQLHENVRDELLENRVSMILATDDLFTPEARSKFFDELAFEFSTMHELTLVQQEEYTPAPTEKRRRGEKEEYMGRTIKVVED